jgi:GAF domain-containing protein
MGKSLLHADTIELAMADVVNAAVQFVNGCDSASFAALVGDVVTTVASTGLAADELDQAQYETAEGPCLQAIRTLELVICDDLSRDDRWPAFVAAARGSARSAMATPVADDLRPDSPFGSLNSYAQQAFAFHGEDVDTAMLLTAHLGVLLCLARTTSESTDRAVQLAEAVNTRDVIGQAKGILMERHRLTAAQAFDLLRTASQRLNRKLRDVADDLATSGEVAAPKR